MALRIYFILFAVVACFTLKQLQDEVCRNLCLDRKDGGYSVNGKCVCTENEGKISDFARHRIYLPNMGGLHPDKPGKSVHLEHDED